MTTTHDPIEDRYLRLSELARYSSLSIRTLQRVIRDPRHPLPVHRVMGRTVLVKRSEFDQWVREGEQLPAGQAPQPTPEMARKVRAAVRSIRGR